MKRLVLILAVLCTSVGLASSQSLVEVAKKEKERRKKVDAQEKQSFTETDLRGGPRLPARTTSSAPTPTAGSAAAPEGGGEPAAEQDPTTTESYWKERVSTVNKKIQDLEAKLKSPELTSDPRGADRRAAVERDLAKARSEKQGIADEARKKGVPPGWLR
jgi:hypothetical protein